MKNCLICVSKTMVALTMKIGGEILVFLRQIETEIWSRTSILFFFLKEGSCKNVKRGSGPERHARSVKEFLSTADLKKPVPPTHSVKLQGV